VVGFDFFAPNSAQTITGAIDMSELPYLYLGTATQVTYAGSINSGEAPFRFSGVKGGQVTVTSPSLTESHPSSWAPHAHGKLRERVVRHSAGR